MMIKITPGTNQALPSKKNWFTRLAGNTALQVLAAIVAGILVGHFNPPLGVKMEIVGKTFINIIKLFIGPIIFLTIVLGISSIGDLKKVGRVGIKALVYFEIVTTLSLALGLFVAYFFKPGAIDIAGLTAKDPSAYTSKAPAFSWISFFLSNFTLQVLVVGILSGFIISHLNKRQRIVEVLDIASQYVFKILKYVMYLAPLGAFGGMAFAVGKFGIATLLPLGKLMLCIYLAMALFVCIVLGLILRYYKMNIWDFLKYIKEELLIVLATSFLRARAAITCQ